MAAGAQPNSFTDRAFFEALVQNGSDAIITIDTDDQIRFANDATREVFGYEPEELIGESLTTIMPERFQSVHRAAIEQYLETGERTFDWSGIELPAQHRDGHEVQISVTFEEYEYEGQTMFSGIMRDVSERKERERKLEQQNEQLERFASVVSHDLRSPLQTAKAALAVAKATDDDEPLEELDEILDRMSELVDDVLELATQGQTVDETEELSLRSVASDAWNVAGHDHIDFESEDATLSADPERLQTLFENLFRNANEHGDAESIWVESHPGGFAVSDDGSGLGHVDKAQLFEHGYTESDSGTGIGLNIVQTVAQAHGWRVETDESSEEGARFVFHEVTTR
ncbi:PAS domain-containing sensor histidine kinase [Halobacteriales archaeon SW_6_65_46]|nr:MAG: PAS domain-containing sensor histidine kinase [Halobacteriales archaeon SW_6_65_46]